MKNNKILIIAGILLLNVLVVFMIGQSLLGKETEYDKILAEARSFAKQELCSRSIEKYEAALLLEDTLDVRIEMMEVYDKGLYIGELTSVYDFVAAIENMVGQYREDAKAYETACRWLMEYEKYGECAEVLMQARDLKVSSESIEEYRGQVRYRYANYYAMYTEVLPSFDGMYTVRTEDAYLFLSDEGAASLEGGYIAASSFSEGYAFVVASHPDGDYRSIVINKDGQRQAYLKGVESSSGVGMAKNEKGDAIYLLACKVGEKYKYFDVNGEETLDEYLFAGRFRNNVAAVRVAEDEWKLIDGTGKAITDTTFSDVVLNEFDECAPKGLIIARTDEQYHIYDLKGKQIGDFTCDEAKAFVDDYAAFRIEEKWGFVDAEGKVLIAPQYEDAKSFSNGMGAVKIDGTWAFINPQNKIVIDEGYEDVDYLNDKGVCFVKKDGFWSYIKMYYTGK